MHTNHLYFALLLIILYSACTDAEIPMQEDPPPEKMLELTYPLVGDDVHYCCFSFEWDDPNNEKEYRIQIARFSSFNDLLLDTIVSGTSLEFPSFLNPRSTYNWKVTALDSEVSQKSEFKIIDYSEYLMGSYEATINSYSWLAGEGSTDTTHQTTLKMYKGDGHTMAYKSDHSNGEFNIPFSGLLKDGYVLYRIDHGYPAFIDFIEYHFEADSIIAYSESGGNGGGGHTRITASRK